MEENSSIPDNLDIVCMSLSRWDADISSPAASLAKEFAKTHRVFFIQHPYTLKAAVAGERSRSKQEEWERVGENLVVVRPPVALSINFLPPGIIYNFFSGINNRILVRTLRRTLNRFKVGKYIFINFFDPFFLSRIPDNIAPLRYVYQCMDDMSQVAYTNRHGVRLENDVIQRADLVLCTSRELVRLKSAYSNKVKFHPNGADFELFNTAAQQELERPADLKFEGKKIIGFTGSIEYRTDFELLAKIAERHREKIIFLLGPVSGNEHLQRSLDKMPNVVFAGPRKLHELPVYLKYFDCCIIPYKKNVLTSSIYPLKINEYLAAAKPVVATAFSEDIRSFSEVAYIADDHDSFLKMIDEAIDADNEQKKAARVKVAAANSWRNRVNQFWQMIT